MTSYSDLPLKERLEKLRAAEGKPTAAPEIIRNFYDLPDPPARWFPITKSGSSALIAYKMPSSPSWSANIKAASAARRRNVMKILRKGLYYRLCRTDLRKLFNGAKVDMKNLSEYEPEWKWTYEEYRNSSRPK